MTIRLNGSVSGYTQLDSPATGGNNTLVLPTGNGSNGQYLQTNGSGTLSWATLPTSGQIVNGTAVTISGNPTNISFTGLPASVQRLVLTMYDVDPSGSDTILFQLGTSSGYQTSSYSSHAQWSYSSSTGTVSRSDAFHVPWSSSTAIYGAFEIQRQTGNKWICRAQHLAWDGGNVGITHTAGGVALSAELDRVQLAFSGSNTFIGSGTVNVHWEL